MFASVRLCLLLLCLCLPAMAFRPRSRRQWPGARIPLEPWQWPTSLSDNPEDNVIDFPEAARPPASEELGRPQWRPTNDGAPTTESSEGTTEREESSSPSVFHLAPEGCNCPFTPQFNPVCGSDGNTYKNSGLLRCFRRCGIDVTQRRMGVC